MAWTICLAIAAKITGDYYRIGQSSVLHSFQNNVVILTTFSRFIAYTVQAVHTKNMPLGDIDLFQSLKMSDPNILDIRRLIKNYVEKKKTLRAK